MEHLSGYFRRGEKGPSRKVWWWEKNAWCLPFYPTNFCLLLYHVPWQSSSSSSSYFYHKKKEKSEVWLLHHFPWGILQHSPWFRHAHWNSCPLEQTIADLFKRNFLDLTFMQVIMPNGGFSNPCWFAILITLPPHKILLHINQNVSCLFSPSHVAPP